MTSMLFLISYLIYLYFLINTIHALTPIIVTQFPYQEANQTLWFFQSIYATNPLSSSISYKHRYYLHACIRGLSLTSVHIRKFHEFNVTNIENLRFFTHLLHFYFYKGIKLHILHDLPNYPPNHSLSEIELEKWYNIQCSLQIANEYQQQKVHKNVEIFFINRHLLVVGSLYHTFWQSMISYN